MSDTTQKPADKKLRVLVLFNQVGEDWYEKLRQVDPKTLKFEPEYPIHVPTVAEECEDIARALRRAGYRARAYNLQNDLRRLERVLRRSRPDVIFNLVEFFHDDAGMEAAVAGVFDLYQIPYTGSAPFTLELCQRKGLTKRVLLDYGIATPRFKILEEPAVPAKFGLAYPVIVKPAWEDASAGVDERSVVYNDEQLGAWLPHVFREFDQPMLIEEFIDGPELHVSVWGNDPPLMLPPIEFDFSEMPEGHPPIVSYQAKWDPLSEVYHRVHTICPARLSKRVMRKVEEVAIHTYEVAECRDYARLDIRLKGNKPYVLEVNPNPDLTEGVSFMESAERAGHSFSEALSRIVEMAAERKPQSTPAPGTTPGQDWIPGPLPTAGTEPSEDAREE
ncbi:MAG: ATP-grasp domain-containing protein [Gemmatimonadota bacterium]|nr:MAG: ATP-grasp domain-containing protein [Gemmatimonadota bacterium]